MLPMLVFASAVAALAGSAIFASWNCTGDQFCRIPPSVKAGANMSKAACQAACSSDAQACFAYAYYPNLCGPTQPGTCLLCRVGFQASKSACPHATLCVNPDPPPPPPPPPPPLPGWVRLHGVNAMRYWSWPRYTRASDQLDAGAVVGYFGKDLSCCLDTAAACLSSAPFFSDTTRTFDTPRFLTFSQTTSPT